jgi:hypothetical protein
MPLQLQGTGKLLRLSKARRQEVLAACDYVCVFCRFLLRRGAPTPKIGPDARLAFPDPSVRPTPVTGLDDTLAFRGDVDALFPLGSHPGIERSWASAPPDHADRLRNRWLVAACAACRAGRQSRWTEPGDVLAIYGMHLYVDSDERHEDLVHFIAALRAYRHARALSQERVTGTA